MINFIKRIRRYKINKEHFALVKEAWCGKSYDQGYLTSLEEKKIYEMLVYHKEKSVIPIDNDERKRIIFWLEIAYNLLKIINGKANISELVDDPDCPDTIKDENGNDKPTPAYIKKKVKCIVNVNMRNMNRFVKKNMEGICKQFPDELYLLKAKHLYYMIRERYTDDWWD